MFSPPELVAELCSNEVLPVMVTTDDEEVTMAPARRDVGTRRC